MKAQLDLRELALDRPKTRQAHSSSRRSSLVRFWVPLGILAGFVALLGFAVRDQFLPRKPVTVVPVVMMRAEIREEGTPLFQAAGWIEPRPTAIHVAALTEGIVEELLVVEGQEVQAQEPIARLVKADAEWAVRDAKAALALRVAELQSAEAERKAAALRLKHPVTLDADLAEAESQWARIKTELGKVPFLIDSASARMEFAQKDYDGKRQGGGGVPMRTIQEAESELAALKAEWQELNERKRHLEQEALALGKKVDALKTQRELLIDESQAKEDTEAKVLAAQARADQAQLLVEKAELALERTVVKSPIAGRVLELIAPPGTRVMGLESSSEQSSSTVVTLYDPKRLQVRADVRLEDVPLVQPGQPVEIETSSSKELLRGVVLSLTSSANVQKNTLEVKVSLLDPPPTVTPEMLVTATFLAPPKPHSEGDESQETERLLVPRALVQSSENAHAVWIVDASGLAQKRSVELGRAGTKELVEVTQGVVPTDKLITSGTDNLNEGDRVTITGEDQLLGLEDSGF